MNRSIANIVFQQPDQQTGGTSPAAADPGGRRLALPLIAALVAVALILATAWRIDRSEQSRYASLIRTRAGSCLEALSIRLEGELQARVEAASVLGARCEAGPESGREHLARVANSLGAADSCVTVLQLAPNGVVAHEHALRQGQGSSIGENLLRDPVYLQAYRQAERTGQPAVFGPVESKSGLARVVAMQPVFAPAKAGGKFRGVALAVIDLNRLLSQTAAYGDAPDLEVAIQNRQGGRQRGTFWGEAGVLRQHPVHARLQTSLINWDLAAAPSAGWPTLSPDSWLFRLAALALALLAGLLTWRVGKEPARLRRAVNEATRALQASRAKYRTLTRVSPVGIFQADSAGHCNYVNEMATRLSGLSVEAMLGQGWRAALHPEDRRAVLTDWALCIEHRLPFSGEFRFRRPDGSVVWVLGQAQPTMGPQGSVTGYVGTLTDLTAYKRVEQALARNEARFRSLLENAQDIIAVHGPEGELRYISPAVGRVLGYSPAEVLGKPFWEYVHPEDLADVRSRFARLLSSEPRDGYVNFRARHADGSWRDLESIGTVVRTETGEREVVVNSRDVTDRKRAEEALRESQVRLLRSQRQEAIGRLAGGIAHDFNNLLTAIAGYSELVLQRLPTEDAQREDIEQILAAANRATRLVRQLLAFSRRQILKPEVINLNDAIRDLEKMLRRVLNEDIDFLVVLDSDLGQVKADPAQIEQVVMNLVLNARDSMPHGGQLTVQTDNVEVTRADWPQHADLKPGPYVRIKVRDTGAGMDAETLEHIFEPFFTTKEQGEGTGLGLATVEGVVRQSDGSIEVESEPGMGSVFQVYLPRFPGSARPVAEEHPSPASAPGRETVLLVEDEAAVRRLTARMLEAQGYDVLAAANGEMALELCDRHSVPIDVLITDVVLPGMSGPALAGELRRRSACKVLFISGHSDQSVMAYGGLGAAPALLRKPFNSAQLTRKLRQLLDEPEQIALAS